MATLRELGERAGRAQSWPLTRAQWRASIEAIGSHVDIENWTIKELSGLVVTEHVLDVLVRRDVDGYTLNWFASRGEGHYATLAKTMSSEQLIWFLSCGPLEAVSEIASCDLVHLTDRLAAIGHLADRLQARVEIVRDAIHTLKKSEHIASALERVKRVDVLFHFATKTEKHVWEPRVATHLLDHGVIAYLNGGGSVPVKGLQTFIRKACLTPAQLTNLATHSQVRGTAAASSARLLADELESIRRSTIDEVAHTLSVSKNKQQYAAEVERVLFDIGTAHGLDWAASSALMAEMSGGITLDEVAVAVRDALA